MTINYNFAVATLVWARASDILWCVHTICGWVCVKCTTGEKCYINDIIRCLSYPVPLDKAFCICALIQYRHKAMLEQQRLMQTITHTHTQSGYYYTRVVGVRKGGGRVPCDNTHTHTHTQCRSSIVCDDDTFNL
jgi:hypothetical protein